MLTWTLAEFCIFIIVVVLQKMDLTLYDPNGSDTSESIACDHEFCSSTYDGPIPGCKAETPCPYSITYGDGSATTGYYVKDYLTFDSVSGNLHTAPQNSSIIFGLELSLLFLHNWRCIVFCWVFAQSCLLYQYHCCWIRLGVLVLFSHDTRLSRPCTKNSFPFELTVLQYLNTFYSSGDFL